MNHHSIHSQRPPAATAVPIAASKAAPNSSRIDSFTVWRRRWCLGLLLLFTAGGGAAEAGTLVQFRLPMGDIEVELFDQDKPITVQNFLAYVRTGRFKDMFIHRWEPGFVIQGGAYYTTNRFGGNPSLDLVKTFGPIQNEYETGRVYSNEYGTIAMARVAEQTNSATSQWFFSLTNNAFLDRVDGGFTVFGRVLGGTNVLNRFNDTSAANGIFIARLQVPLNQLPVLSTNASYGDLVYVDITLLEVRVTAKETGEREISWNSVSNRLHHVEFTDSFPPAWKTLVSTNGAGERLRVVDAGAEGSTRFYRVRVEY